MFEQLTDPDASSGGRVGHGAPKDAIESGAGSCPMPMRLSCAGDVSFVPGGRDLVQWWSGYVDGLVCAAKSLLKVEDGLTLFDVIVRQVLAQRQAEPGKWSRSVPRNLLDTCDESARDRCGSVTTGWRLMSLFDFVSHEESKPRGDGATRAERLSSTRALERPRPAQCASDPAPADVLHARLCSWKRGERDAVLLELEQPRRDARRAHLAWFAVAGGC